LTRALVGAPVGDQLGELLVQRPEQTLGGGVPGRGRRDAGDQPAGLERRGLLAHPGDVERTTVGDRLRIAERGALFRLDEQPGRPGLEIDAGGRDRARDEGAGAAAADEARELAVSSWSESPLVGDANASPTPAVSTVLRSGRSSISHASRNAAATIAAATMKIVCSESVNAPV
jgi:hypothetical protein